LREFEPLELLLDLPRVLPEVFREADFRDDDLREVAPERELPADLREVERARLEVAARLRPLLREVPEDFRAVLRPRVDAEREPELFFLDVLDFFRAGILGLASSSSDARSNEMGCASKSARCVRNNNEFEARVTHRASFQIEPHANGEASAKMTLLNASTDKSERPRGVALISAVLALFAWIALVISILTFTERVPLATGAFLVGGEMETAGPVLFLLVSIVFFVAAAGLWRGKNWARHLAVGLAFIGVVQTIPAISSAVGDGRIPSIIREGLQIIVRVMIAWYLLQEPVRDTFV
jgi:hypothetical protein